MKQTETISTVLIYIQYSDVMIRYGCNIFGNGKSSSVPLVCEDVSPAA